MGMLGICFLGVILDLIYLLCAFAGHCGCKTTIVCASSFKFRFQEPMVLVLWRCGKIEAVQVDRAL